MNAAKAEINGILANTGLNYNSKIKKLNSVTNRFLSKENEFKNIKAYANSKIKNLEQKPGIMPPTSNPQPVRQQLPPINRELESFLKNLKNGKNIKVDKILEYSKKLGYEVNTGNNKGKVLNVLRGKVANKNLKRNNQNKIKKSLVTLITKKIQNISSNEIRKNIRNNNLEKILNAVFNSGNKNVNVINKKKIIGYLENRNYPKLKSALEKIRNNIDISNKSLEKNIQRRIQTLINKVNKNSSTSTQVPPPLPPRPTQAPQTSAQAPPLPPRPKQAPQAQQSPTQTPQAPQKQNAPKPGGPPRLFKNGKATDAVLTFQHQGRKYIVTSPPGTANRMKLVSFNNGSLRFVLV